MTRPAAVAGRFYPADPRRLAETVDAMLDTVVVGDAPPARAYVVPHAGHQYSGPTAAHAYAHLRAHRGGVRRFVLVGPAHFAPLAGCAVPAAERWATPLGPVMIDVAGRDALAEAGVAVVDDRPHRPEHSLEVQLPFLLRAVGSAVRVLPVAVGPADPDAVAAMISTAVGEAPAGAVVVCSTDLSHYLDESAALARDGRTVGAVLDLAADRIGDRDACGGYALRGLVTWASRERLTPYLLDRTTSAQTGGHPDRVVGYAALCFT